MFQTPTYHNTVTPKHAMYGWKFPVSYPDANKYFNGPKVYQIAEK